MPFKPGQSGQPKGRAPGSKNRKTLEVIAHFEALSKKHKLDLMELLILQATGRDRSMFEVQGGMTIDGLPSVLSASDKAGLMNSARNTLASYVWPKMKAIEMTAAEPVTVTIVDHTSKR